ncbi:Ubiquitin carboxyl-terminal hydrolase 17-like protein A [Thelohanellus kitauei]|uniref:Ubiquitin carboxyl-terminal hydrolase 17-like protein A n=1 Tax=Thelohanellus kitauei TaxID=669202 RepID=A0A0C2J5J1_THEKT|nr:Ubiquitin carboxyl-terminal hydrolase 17-like protein A [Thelohanellus kitauei]
MVGSLERLPEAPKHDPRSRSPRIIESTPARGVDLNRPVDCSKISCADFHKILQSNKPYYVFEIRPQSHFRQIHLGHNNVINFDSSAQDANMVSRWFQTLFKLNDRSKHVVLVLSDESNNMVPFSSNLKSEALRKLVAKIKESFLSVSLLESNFETFSGMYPLACFKHGLQPAKSLTLEAPIAVLGNDNQVLTPIAHRNKERLTKNVPTAGSARIQCDPIDISSRQRKLEVSLNASETKQKVLPTNLSNEKCSSIENRVRPLNQPSTWSDLPKKPSVPPRILTPDNQASDDLNKMPNEKINNFSIVGSGVDCVSNNRFDLSNNTPRDLEFKQKVDTNQPSDDNLHPSKFIDIEETRQSKMNHTFLEKSEYLLTDNRSCQMDISPNNKNFEENPEEPFDSSNVNGEVIQNGIPSSNSTSDVHFQQEHKLNQYDLKSPPEHQDTSDEVAHQQNLLTTPSEQSTSMNGYEKLSYSPKANYGPYLVGFENDSLICYMNSVFQCLFSIPLFRKFLIAAHNMLKDLPEPSKIIPVMYQYLKDIMAGQEVPLPMVIMKQVIFSVLTNLQNGVQQDAHEFLIFLLDAIESEIKSGQKIFYQTTIFDEKNTDLVKRFDKLFYGKIHYIFECKRCDGRSDIEERFNHITIPLVSDVGASNHCQNLKSFINHYFSTEYMSSNIPWVCEKCKSNESKQTLYVEYMPSILIFHTARNEMNGMKILTKFEYSQDRLDLKLPFYRETIPMSYSLVSVVHHRGVTTYSGHYIATCKRPSRSPKILKWYRFDDDNIDKIESCEDPFISSTDFLIFYTESDSLKYIS